MAADTKAELVPPRVARRERKIVATDVVAHDDEHRSPVIAEQAIAAFEHAPSQNVAGSCGVEHFGVVVATGGDQIGDLGAFAIDDAQQLSTAHLDRSTAVRGYDQLVDLAQCHDGSPSKTSSPIGVGCSPLIGT